MINQEEALSLAIEWAREAGRIQLFYFRGNNLGIETKSNVYDVVTRADKQCEAYIIEQIGHHFPTHAVLGEESGEHTGTGDYCWIIDPLDGTNNFSQGLPVFTVSIGLQYKNETIMGVVYAPYLNEMYTALRGHGAFLNDKRIFVSDKNNLNYCILGTGFPYDKDVNPDNNVQNLARILPHLRGMRRMGSAAYDLACVAAGLLDGYWELGLHAWDICAGVLLVEEAGGTTHHFRYNRHIAIIAGNPEITEEIKKYIE